MNFRMKAGRSWLSKVCCLHCQAARFCSEQKCLGNDLRSGSPLRAEGTVASGGVSRSWQSTVANKKAASITLKVPRDMTPFAMHARSIFFLPLLCKGSVPSTQPLQGAEQSQACSVARLLSSWCHRFRCSMLCSHWFVSPPVHAQQILCSCLICFKN